MKQIGQLTLRNIRIFTRDRMSFFFSMFNAVIILALYLLFIRNLNIQGIKQALSTSGLIYADKALDFFIDTWMITGVISVTSITLPFGIYSIVVDDRCKNISKDFHASPISPSKVTLSYVFAVLIISISVIFILLGISVLYIFITTGYSASISGLLSAFGISALSCVCSSLLLIIPAFYIKSQPAFGGLSAILGVVAGFLTGAYMPLNMFPSAIQTIASVIPGTHVTSLLRSIFMKSSLPLLLENAGGMYKTVAALLKKEFGAQLYVFNQSLSFNVMLIYVVAMTIIFFLLSVFLMRKKYVNK